MLEKNNGGNFEFGKPLTTLEQEIDNTNTSHKMAIKQALSGSSYMKNIDQYEKDICDGILELSPALLYDDLKHVYSELSSLASGGLFYLNLPYDKLSKQVLDEIIPKYFPELQDIPVHKGCYLRKSTLKRLLQEMERIIDNLSGDMIDYEY